MTEPTPAAAPSWSTRYSMIERMRDGKDPQAWEDFMQHYRPFIYHLLRQTGITGSDRDDLTQEILFKLYKSLDSYVQQNGRFRSWLGSITRHTIHNFFRTQQRRSYKHTALAESPLFSTLHTETDFEKRVEAEWSQYLINLAMKRLSKIFSPKMLSCFEMTLANVPAEEIARKLKVRKETVYTTRTRMKSRMIHEVQELIREWEF